MTQKDTMAQSLNAEPFEVEQAMVDFFQDAEQHGVLSAEGRCSRLGQRLWCKHCEALKR